MICLYAPLDTKAVCISVKNTTQLVVFTGHGQRFDFLFSVSRAKECLLSTCRHNSSAWLINSRAARVAKLLQTVFWQVALSLTRDTENLTKICNCCPLPCEHHLAICCVLSEISHSNKLVSRGHLANHGFIETAVKGRWIFVAVIKTVGRKSSYITAMFPIMRIM